LDQQYGRRYSYFTTTVAHEFGHAVYVMRLSNRDRALVTDLYLDDLASARRAAEPSEEGAEHYFVDLFAHGLLHVSSEAMHIPGARELLRSLGLP
jgi:hypothetical protein